MGMYKTTAPWSNSPDLSRKGCVNLSRIRNMKITCNKQMYPQSVSIKLNDAIGHQRFRDKTMSDVF